MATKPKRSKAVWDNSIDVDDDDEYTEKHQLLASYLMHTKLIKKMDLALTHRKIFLQEETLEDSLSKINGKLGPLKVDIKELKCDTSGDLYFVVVHVAGESFFNRCSIFSKPQLDFLKQILDGIVLSEIGMVRKIQALNSCVCLSKSEADETLTMFEREKLLIDFQKSGFFCLSPLAVVEFGPYFDTCLSENLNTCNLCKQLVFVGVKCVGCTEKFHNHCVRTWLNNRNECPKCFQEWSNDTSNN